jgi:hypothetical protein
MSDRRPGLKVAVLVLVVPLVLCGLPVVAGVAWYLHRFLVVPTIEAGRGADCPACALDEMLRDGPLGGGDGDDLAVADVLCGERRTELRAQLRDFAAGYQEVADRHGITWSMQAGVVIEGDSPEEMADGHVVIRVPVRVSHERADRPGVYTAIYTREWTVTVVEDGGAGWRVCGIEHPAVCEVLRCGLPSPGSSPAVPAGGRAKASWSLWALTYRNNTRAATENRYGPSRAAVARQSLLGESDGAAYVVVLNTLGPMYWMSATSPSRSQTSTQSSSSVLHLTGTCHILVPLAGRTRLSLRASAESGWSHTRSIASQIAFHKVLRAGSFSIRSRTGMTCCPYSGSSTD